jgi:2-iminobutanoate/2-iminopropanoate deaminase
MTVEYLVTTEAPAAIGPYAQATRAGGFLFTAGQIALDPATGQVVEGDVAVQADRVLRNLSAVLAHGGCAWKDVVKTTIFLTDIGDFSRVNEVYARFLGDTKPARSTVQVAGLPRGVRVEIECVARVP